ncbi:PIN2/TERF1-interacting telomerase inhibitor 1-like isoform X2 [Corticium candelabrum]|uniref:PIN2/TERF1-interacting telomerase inhibitor 1-like isoform X2 n=1 Tax=Corticium candelabrum TaxID=121492 RepID=UPI002E25AE2C|nr:PIN2/TERF1-interacting telomerase inhibitor 1-like isoform X2 [Corticium candelabrum]
MLAERKRKEKWSHDPRNTQWTRDKSKFGYRMLEKMGWKEGKGLGLQEDGSVAVVTVKKKTTNLGVGAKHKHEDNWLENQAAFDDLLATLNTSSTTGVNNRYSVHRHRSFKHSTTSMYRNLITTEMEYSGERTASKVSLQQLSSSSRKRIHYKRFTQGKDLSLASSHDVDSILGRRRVKEMSCESVKDIFCCC